MHWLEDLCELGWLGCAEWAPSDQFLCATPHLLYPPLIHTYQPCPGGEGRATVQEVAGTARRTASPPASTCFPLALFPWRCAGRGRRDQTHPPLKSPGSWRRPPGRGSCPRAIMLHFGQELWTGTLSTDVSPWAMAHGAPPARGTGQPELSGRRAGGQALLALSRPVAVGACWNMRAPTARARSLG